MNGVAAAPVIARSGPGQSRPLTTTRARNQLNPLEALERGLALFQATFSREAWRYYTGAAPLVLFFIPMWVVNGQIRISNGTLLMESTLLTVAYVLRMRLVATYVQAVRERAFGVPRPKVAGAFTRAAGMGRLLAWKISLSVATLATLPTIAAALWFYTACQFADLEAGEDASERHSLSRCLALAGHWYLSSLLLFLMSIPLWAAVWLNGLILALILPQLLHSIFGVNTLLSTGMGTYSLLRSSAFWISLFAAAWLALDPIVKCTFVVVYQHLRSRREGDDLRGLLARLPHEQEKKAKIISSARVGRAASMGSFVIVFAMALLFALQTPIARAAQILPDRSEQIAGDDSTRQARIGKLRQALSEESQRAIYRWHDAEHPSPPTWFDKLLSRIGDALSRAWRAFRNFLRKLWPRGLNLSPGKDKRGWQLKDLRLWLALIAIFTVAVGALLFWLRRRRQAAELSIPVAVAPLPDLRNAVASERSDDEWFVLAERLEREGDLRLALRAAYLGLLAGLARREWLTIRRDRTNREYLHEFTRRWRRRPQAAVEAPVEIPERLLSSFRLFDRVWYGAYALTPAAVAAYRQGQRELLNNV